MKKLLLFICLTVPALAQNPLFFASSYSANVAAAPAFSPPSPYIGNDITVTITSTTPGANITYCMTNSAPPCLPATTYTTGIPFTVSGPETICAFAEASGYAQSPISCWTGTYTVPPAFTWRMAAYDLANTCGVSGTTPCTNGTPFYKFGGFGGSETATTSGATQATYITNALNGQPAVQFSASTQTFALSSSIPAPSTFQYTVFAVFSLSNNAGQFLAGTANGSPTFGMQPVSGSPSLVIGSPGIGRISTDTTALTLNTYYAAIITFDRGVPSSSYYFCSAGTPVLSSSPATTGTGAMNPMTEIGYMPGNLVEIGGFSGIADSTLLNNTCGWAHAKYGI